MVSSVTSLSRDGLRDWLIQRASAVYLLFYIIIMGYVAFSHPPQHYDDFVDLFQSYWVCISTLLAVVAMLAHIWVGLWTVITDYIKCAYLRLLTYGFLWLYVFGCFFWVLFIFFWG